MSKGQRTGERLLREMKMLDELRAKITTELKYPLNEYPEITIVDVIMMLYRHKNRKITNDLIESIQYEMKS